jgi:hypothetical protein
MTGSHRSGWEASSALLTFLEPGSLTMKQGLKEVTESASCSVLCM